MVTYKFSLFVINCLGLTKESSCNAEFHYINLNLEGIVPPDGAVRNTIALKVKFCPSVTTGGALRLNTAAERRES